MKKILWLSFVFLTQSASSQALDGKTVFAKNCAACHQLGGTGIDGAFPALKGNAYVQGDATAVIGTILKGRGGMPMFASSLDDNDLTMVINYIRQAWGNKGSALQLDVVQAVRHQSGAGEVVEQANLTTVH
jgi:mono/diheme cytochrome c family protein